METLVTYLCCYEFSEEGDGERDAHEHLVLKIAPMGAMPHSDSSCSHGGAATQFDPEQEYYINFSRPTPLDPSSIDDVSGVMSDEASAQMAESAESLLMRNHLTPREITMGLDKYNRAIRFTNNFENKKGWIERLENHKHVHDRDNTEDREKANTYLSNARLTHYASRKRIEFYQYAIKYTNDIAEKRIIMLEYKRYCYSAHGK
jgi:hypothetical protein